MSQLLPFIIFGVFFAGILYYSNRQKKVFQNLIEGLGGNYKSGCNGDIIVGGNCYFISYFAGSKNQSSYFRISSPKTSPGLLTIRKESSVDKFFKRIGLNSEIQLQDPEFNSLVYLEGEDKEFIQKLFFQSKAREITKRLLKTFTAIKLDPRGCVLELSPCRVLSSLSPQMIREAAQDFSDFLVYLPEHSSPQILEARQKFSKNMINWFLVSLFSTFISVFLALGCAQTYPAVDTYHLVITGVVAGVIVWMFLVGFIYNMAKGYAAFGGFIILIAIYLCITSIVGSIGLVYLINGFGDPSDEVLHECKIAMRQVRHGRNHGVSYCVSVVSWHKDNHPYRFNVSYQDYAETGTQTRYMIYTKKGNLGYEWVKATSRESNLLRMPEMIRN